MSDCVMEMITELRAQLPPLPALVSDADARTQWLSAMRELVLAMPTHRQRCACIIQIADDLTTLRYPGLPISMVVSWLCGQWGIAPEEMTLEEEAR